MNGDTAKMATTRTRKAAPTSPKPPADEIETETTAVAETPEVATDTDESPAKKTRQADPLLAAKRRLEAARKRHAKATKKWDSVSAVEQEKREADAELDAAKEAFQALVSDLI